MKKLFTICFGFATMVVLLIGCSMEKITADTSPATPVGSWRSLAAPRDVEVATAFQSDGEVHGISGVNRFFVTYRVENGKLIFGALGSTRMEGPDPAMRYEPEFLSALNQVDSFKICNSHCHNLQFGEINRMNTPAMYYADESRKKHYAKDPAVVWFGGRYLMYYSVPPYLDHRLDDGWEIGVAESRDLDHWTKITDLPRFTILEKHGFCAPGALVAEGKVHLFYQTYGNGSADAVCHAESVDGVHFTPDSTNPIFSPVGNWTCGRAIDADVIEYQGKYFLYVATRDPAMKIQKLAVATAVKGTGFSRAAWRQAADFSILEPEEPWEGKCIEAPGACLHNGKIYLFYGGSYNNTPQQIGCAVSEDGIHFIRVSDHPVLPNGKPGSWNSSESGHPFVFTAPNGSQHLFYQGNCDQGASWYLSRKEIQWKDGIPRF